MKQLHVGSQRVYWGVKEGTALSLRERGARGVFINEFENEGVGRDSLGG